MGAHFQRPQGEFLTLVLFSLLPTIVGYVSNAFCEVRKIQRKI